MTQFSRPYLSFFDSRCLLGEEAEGNSAGDDEGRWCSELVEGVGATEVSRVLMKYSKTVMACGWPACSMAQVMPSRWSRSMNSSSTTSNVRHADQIASRI